MMQKMPPSFGRYYKMRIDAGWGQPPVKPDNVNNNKQQEFDYDTYGGGVENFETYKKYTKK